MSTDRRSVREGEAEFFNDRIGQHFPRDALDLGMSLFAAKSTGERKLEVFSLAHALQPLVAHLVESSLDGFALRIEDSFLQRHVDVSSHGNHIIQWPIVLQRGSCTVR